MTLLWVAIGGALGAALRYLSVAAMMRAIGPGFPYGTMTVNVLGSFLMGIAAVLVLDKFGGGRAWAFAMTGVLGGFTTFSAFSLDAVYLIEKGRMAAAAGYIGGTVALCIAALMIGLWLGRAAT